jgi:curved DNA binding protein
MGKKEEDDDVSSVDIDAEEEEAGEDETKANDLNDADIVTKYRTAGDIANKVMAAVVESIKPGIKVVELCTIGDNLINEAVGKIYNAKKGGKKIEKGSAFPTCVSVNNCVGHCSPLESESSLPEIASGDVVKIDLGVHVDGYIAVIAHTAVCEPEEEVTGRKADVIMAAWTAAELAQRMFKDGAKNGDITAMISKVAADFKCSAVEGVLSHQMKKHVIDANKVIINNQTTEQQVKDAVIEPNDVFAMDIVMSTGEGKPRQLEARTTVFKRDLETKYSLKMKASRQFFSEVNAQFPTLPFTLRAAKDERAWKMGVIECVKHGLFIEYPVLYEKPDELVSQFKFTQLLLPSGNPVRTTATPPPNVKSEYSLTDETLIALLAETTDKKKKKKANKKKAKADGEGGDDDAKE